MTQVAVFGGSFDPPHIAHVLCACWARAVADIDRVLIVPTYQHAFGKDSVAFEQRVQMCELAFQDIRGVEISLIEKELGGESRTYHTLRALQKEMPEAKFRLVIGADILEQTERWFRWADVEAMAPPLVVGRDGYPLPDPDCPVILPNVSSTEVRRRLSEREPAEGFVPAAVLDHIKAHQLYAAN